MATTKGVFNSVLNNFSLGTNVSKSENTNYQAEEDGFFIGTIITIDSTTHVERLTALSDSAGTPTTVKGYATILPHSAAQNVAGQAASFCIPVKKNDFYRATYTLLQGSTSSTRVYTWIPFSKTSST